MGSFSHSYLLYMRERQEIQGKQREILRLMMRARGAISLRLIEYHVWERHGLNVPLAIRFYFPHIRAITGLGIRHYLPERCVCLCPDLNESWCVPEVWEGVGA